MAAVKAEQMMLAALVAVVAVEGQVEQKDMLQVPQIKVLFLQVVGGVGTTVLQT
jgi:hypothetical protein